MRFEDGQESNNVEDRRGGGGGGRLPVGGRTIGVGTVVLALVAWYFGIDPSVVLNGAGTLSGAGSPTQVQAPADPNAPDDPGKRFVRQVLGDTERTWDQVFAEAGSRYVAPRLVLFSGATPTACGTGQTAMGPFYCPLDQKVYIDLAFYEELQRRFHAPGDFAQAYVIAHEVGHHVQNLLGISDKVRQAQQRASEAQANALSVRLELQADCFAGVWAGRSNQRHSLIEEGDVEEALAAATAIGDDTLQKSARGYAVPETFTHGTSAQRVRWFKRGLDGGNLDQCNTFAGGKQ
ncbi:MAG: neutral zinc metallopeptidase [Rhodocyclaceae bacterium]